MAKKVAIVHDWLIGGGAEKVVQEIHRLYPDAPIYTSYCTDEWRQKLDNKVVIGYLQKWPFSILRKFIPFLRFWWFARLDLSEYDLVISSSGNGEAKNVNVRPEAKHVCYCHSPTHFYWRHYEKYLKSPGFGIFNPFAKLGLKILAAPLRKLDYKSAQKPDVFIANSNHIKDDIKRYYDRDSVVVHPPVDIKRFNKAKAKERKGFVTAGRLVPHKHVEVIVEACSRLDLPLTVIGKGPELKNLQRMAGPSAVFAGFASDEEMVRYFAAAEAFLFASYEDFGVTPIEAMAAGTPVIAYQAGGALDYVKPGKTGEFFGEQTADSLMEVLKDFDGKKYSSGDIKKAAEKFSEKNFQKNLQTAINKVLQ